MEKGRIIYLNGVTSSGKTSIVEALQKRRDVFFYVVANDLFQEMIGEDSKTVVIFINQLREKVGIVYGNPEVTPGGRALKFYASVRIDVRRMESIKTGTDIAGNRTRAKITKNKMAPPFKEAEFDIIFGEGISNDGCILDLAVDADIIKKGGAWYSYNQERLGQGRENVRKYLQENPEFMAMIEEKVRNYYAGTEEENPSDQ